MAALLADDRKRFAATNQTVLAGGSAAQIGDGIAAAFFDKKELATVESGAMCFMLPKQGYLSDRDGHWHPHLMFSFQTRSLQPGARGLRALRL
jgi:predicted RecA/RadA family phage recombinase